MTLHFTYLFLVSLSGKNQRYFLSAVILFTDRNIKYVSKLSVLPVYLILICRFVIHLYLVLIIFQYLLGQECFKLPVVKPHFHLLFF